MYDITVEEKEYWYCQNHPVFVATAYLDCPVEAIGKTKEEAIDNLRERLGIIKNQIDCMFKDNAFDKAK